MGIIAGVLLTAGYLKTFDIPVWVILSAHAAIALGTLSGGWRIIHTMGSKITRLQPVGGFAAETAGAITLFVATAFGVPVSTTHTITGAIVGVGTVITPAQMSDMDKLGCAFAVLPGSSPKLLQAAKDFKMPLLPGSVTASEGMNLLEQGYSFQKFFPAEPAGGGDIAIVESGERVRD
jgi:hypothetical protein